MRDISYRVALGGIVSALCLVTMFLAGVLPALYLLLPGIAGILLMIIAVEVNTGWAFLTYLAVSLLSVFVTFDKEAALIFIMFFGHYPILRFYIEKIPLRLLKLIIKLAIFNVCIIGYFYITVYFLGLDEMLEEFDDMGRYGAYIMLGISNLVFLVYDLDLDFMYKLYRKRLMPKFRKKR
ncbi:MULTISPECIES: hypothetical protein [Ruminococcus]|uniref:Energy-coupling factor transport system substrate-specific component n=1 Tax=Ruminococcus flavefaciens TaxID=1265 RepID=A0A1M7HV65_RUMFL|nr:MULTISPECIES: hypothetical protein [Ruminococcus]MCR4796055.1 hypothetical protein [Ruminococcus sp.]SHM32233.1 hypothetical protein SAMN04487860_103109 [Ruminococcus flavefaciens]